MESDKERVEELKSEAHQRVEKAGEVYNRVRDSVSQGTDTARKRAQEAYDRAQQAYGRVADTSVHDVQHSLEDYTRTQPLKALLIAAGVGLVAGLFLRSHR